MIQSSSNFFQPLFSMTQNTRTPDNTTSTTTNTTDITNALSNYLSSLQTNQLSDSQAQTILKNQPFTPTDTSLFKVYDGAPAYQPAAAPTTPKTDTQWKSFVVDKMFHFYQAMSPQQSFITDATNALGAANLVNDPTLTQVIPDIRLRTAAAMLKGTVANGAIDVLKSGTFSKVQFADLAPSINAESVKAADGSNQILVNSRYQNEDPRALASLIAHEASHMDSTDSLAEEKINYAMDSMLYGGYVMADSSLPLEQTEQIQRRNTELLARMNDRDANTGNLRILSANGDNVYPGSNVSLPNFAANIQQTDTSNPVADTSPGNAYLRDFVQRMTGKDLGSGIAYDNNTLNAIDSSQTLFTLQQLIQIDRNLKLNVPNP